MRGALLVASRDLARFWQYRFWLAGQLAMNLADVAIFALLFTHVVNRAYVPDYLRFLTPGVAAIATFAAAFSIGREVGVEVRRDMHHYLLALPMSRWELVAGRILGGMLRGMAYQLPFLALAAILLRPPTPQAAAYAAACTAMLTASMSSLAIALSTATRDFNLQAALRSVTYYLLFFLSTVFYPPEVLELRLPPQAAHAIALTPVSLASDLYRWAFGYYPELDAAGRLALLGLWSLLLAAAASALYMRNLSR